METMGHSDWQLEPVTGDLGEQEMKHSGEGERLQWLWSLKNWSRARTRAVAVGEMTLKMVG